MYISRVPPLPPELVPAAREVDRICGDSLYMWQYEVNIVSNASSPHNPLHNFFNWRDGYSQTQRLYEAGDLIIMMHIILGRAAQKYSEALGWRFGVLRHG